METTILPISVLEHLQSAIEKAGLEITRLEDADTAEAQAALVGLRIADSVLMSGIATCQRLDRLIELAEKQGATPDDALDSPPSNRSGRCDGGWHPPPPMSPHDGPV